MGSGTPTKPCNVLYVVFSSGQDDAPNPIYVGRKFRQEPPLVSGPDSEAPVSYPAPWRWGYGGGPPQPNYQLWNYTIDGVAPYEVLTGKTLLRMPGMPQLDPDDPANTDALNAALDNPLLIFPVDLTGYPHGFDNLVLYYAFHEGGPHLTVAAIVEGGPDHGAIKPIAVSDHTHAPPPIDGENASCPIAKAYSGDDPDAVEGDAFPLSNFTWDPDGIGLYGVPGTGGWVTTAIGSQPYLTVVAKPEMEVGSRPHRYSFDRWVYRTKLQGFDLPDTSTELRYPLPAQRFGGAIAYYRHHRAARPSGTTDPITRPQPITIADPPIRQLLTLLAHEVAYDIALLVRGLVQPSRHAPGTAEHGRSLAAPTVDPATHAQIVELAKRYPEDGGELERTLSGLHR